MLAPDRLPFALIGEWAGGGAILGSEPVEVVRGDAALDALDRVADGTSDAGSDRMSDSGGIGSGSGIVAEPGVIGGGWFGYLGYQTGSAIEQLPPGPPRVTPLPTAQLSFYDHVLRLDAGGQWWFEALNESAVERRFAVLQARVDAVSAQAPVHEPWPLATQAQVPAPRSWRLGEMRAHGAGATGHLQAVAECRRRITGGDLFQANICLRLGGDFEGSAGDAFADGCDQLNPRYGAYFALETGAVLSFSPELFLRREGRSVRTEPIKGTTARDVSARPDPAHEAGAAPDPLLDAAPDPLLGAAAKPDPARTALIDSGKDASEHVMIVDLMRNDLGRVARYGTVVADEEPEAQPHPGVWHLVSGVGAELRDDVSDGDLLRATFPPGSVTGAPKVQAMKVIAELEGSAREVYTGAIGYVSPAAGLELSVAIRTLEVRGTSAWLGAGGGIVAGSDPQAELAEAYAKAAPILEALGSRIADEPPAGSRAASGNQPVSSDTPAGPPIDWAHTLRRRPDPQRGVYDTVLVRGGVAVELKRHLERLGGSAHDLFGIELPATAMAQATQVAASAADETSRMRLLLAPDGELKVTVVAANSVAMPMTLTPVIVAGGLGPYKLTDRAPLLEFEHPGQAAVICDIDGAVLEASYANIWALIDGRLITPPADGRLLPGTVRRWLLESGKLGDIELAVASFTLEEARRAGALITTSSIRLAAPATVAGTDVTAAAHDLACALISKINN